jgi:hypothetical protein
MLAVCLASLSPMTANEIFDCVNAGNNTNPVAWEDFTKHLSVSLAPTLCLTRIVKDPLLAS